jgi:hypothetical protein
MYGKEPLMKKLNATTIQITLSSDAISAVERIARASLSDPSEIIDRIIQNHVRSSGVSGPPPEEQHHAELAVNSSGPSRDLRTRPKKRYLMRAPEMFQRGLLRAGMRLRLRNYPGHDAFVHDAKNVSYQGKVMTYNAWGSQVSDSSICIYDYAQLDDGRILGDLRDGGYDPGRPVPL